MVGTWSGTFTSEAFTGPGAYQAKNGVRCFVDMATTPGAVTVTAPVGPEDNESFIVAWDNPDRETLTFTAAEDYEDPVSILNATVPTLVTAFQRGMIGFTFASGQWELSDWNQFGISLRTTFAVQWIGRNTNGLATLTGDFHAVEVERTGVGLYTVRLDAGTLVPVSTTMVVPAPNAVGLPTDNKAEVMVGDIGMAVADEILVETGIRNKGGVFQNNDLIQDASNRVAIIGQTFP